MEMLRIDHLKIDTMDEKNKQKHGNTMGVEPKIGGKTPKSSHFNRVFHYFHHPFWGGKIPPFFGKAHMIFDRERYNISPPFGKPENHRLKTVSQAAIDDFRLQNCPPHVFSV